MSTAIIYEGGEGTPVDGEELRIVGAPADRVVEVADGLADAFDRIELCGGLGAVPHRAVHDAVAGRARVGLVTYGFESLEAVADYKRGFGAGEPRTGAFVYLDPTAGAAGRRVVADDTTFVGVPDAAAAADVAREVAAGGATLVELYAGLGTAAASAVIAATDRDVAIGVALYED